MFGVLDEYGALQAALNSAVALEKRTRRRAGRGLTERVATWMTVRLAGGRFHRRADVRAVLEVCKRQ